MGHRLPRVAVLVVFLFSLLAGMPGAQRGAAAQAPEAVIVPTAALPESNDYATLNWDAWDMSEQTDVSQYLNGAGRHPSLANITFNNGVFSADSIGDVSTGPVAFFHLLFPGYHGFMQVGHHYGSIKPINPAQYDCLYLAMKVDSPAYRAVPGAPQPDSFQVWWDSNDQTTDPRGGFPVRLYPETVPPGATTHVPRWKLYRVDLNNPPTVLYGSAWKSNSRWTGLQIMPTFYSGVHFQVDWARLTQCSQDARFNATITWSPDSNVNSIWVRPAGTSRDIQVITGLNGSSGKYTLDTRGLTPGQYQVGLGTVTSCCSQWSTNKLTINQTAVATFTRPSAYSGEDYATQAGNPWNMDAGDVTGVACANYAFGSSGLIVDTPPPSQQPAQCVGAPPYGESEPRIYMNMPGAVPNAGAYRYFSFRVFQNGAVSMPADGMIGRWMWTRPGDLCTSVTHDIPLDVGWQTYWIDLYDAFMGSPEETAPSSCPKTHWTQAGAVQQFRFDPNENYTGKEVQPAFTFHQEFAWMRLTKQEHVVRGMPFATQVTLSKPYSANWQIRYYYTDDLNNPQKYPAVGYNPGQPRLLRGGIYLPLIITGMAPTGVEGPSLFTWDTSGVTAGQYFICMNINDGLNSHTSCSDVPVLVTAQ